MDIIRRSQARRAGSTAILKREAGNAAAGPKRRYASVGMTQRRQRIIDEAHAILGEGGVQALTIERLCRQAEVAPRTIYRLFDDKEGVIFATVSDRMKEVRAHLTALGRQYSIEEVFEELAWMVSEMYRDEKYARVVIDFYFSQQPRVAAVRELRSVAYNRFRNWMDCEIRAGHTLTELDLERIAQEHVDTEFLVYHRWAQGRLDRDPCVLELQANFLKSAILVLREPLRTDYTRHLTELHRQLGLSAIGSAASTNRAERDTGDHFVGKA